MTRITLFDGSALDLPAASHLSVRRRYLIMPAASRFWKRGLTAVRFGRAT